MAKIPIPAVNAVRHEKMVHSKKLNINDAKRPMKLRERTSKPLSKRQIPVNVVHLSSGLFRKKATLAMSPPRAGNKRLRARPQSTAAEQGNSFLSTFPQSKKRRNLMAARGTMSSDVKIPRIRK